MSSPWPVLAAVALTAGCGRIGFAVHTDASADAVRPMGPFGSPAVVVELSSPSRDDDPDMTADGLELYFSSERPGGSGDEDIWRAVRSDPASPWDPPTPVVELNSVEPEDNPGISPDGLLIVFDRGLVGDLFAATRPDRASAFGPPVVITELNTGGTDTGPALLSSTHLVFYRQLGNRDLFEATRATPGGLWETATPITSVNTAADEQSPFLATVLELYFASNRPGTTGAEDLYVAVRAAPGQPFEPPVALPSDLQSTSVDDDPCVSADGHLLLFASDRGGNLDIYEARR